MNKILNTLKGFVYIGDKASSIKDKFVKKIDLHIEITPNEGYDVKVPEKKLQIYIEVFKDTFPECRIIL
tara:strand:+ start:2110 stop:2316 length:207 start_codon:yes stop_codon:yes gene_type:complete